MAIEGPVLVIDANLVMTAIVAERLAQVGLADVHQSTNLRQSITFLEQNRYGLIMAEYDLHPITGFDLWRVLTGRPEWSSVPFILMASEERKRANIIRFEDAGLPMVLVKPFSVDQLKGSIDVATSANPFGLMV